jgi:SH3-like domain-containing protein
MRSARALGSAMALLATAVVAAPGDPLVVTSDVANVRAGPGTDNPVLFHVSRDQQVVELTRTGNWVQVQIPDEAADGWIHQSLLQVVERAQPAPDVGTGTVGARSASSESEAIAVFRSNVGKLNARAVAVAGVELFAGAEPADGGTVRVMVTEAWDLIPEAGQQSYTNALFDQWRAAARGSEPLRLQVVDPDGTIVREKSGPTTP